MNKRAARLRPLFLAEGEGFAPLAARPGEQPTGLFSLRPSLLFTNFTRANRSLYFGLCPRASRLRDASASRHPAAVAGARASTLESLSLFVQRERGGIRTPGGFHLNGFQDRRDRPLRHPSVSAAPKGSRFLLFSGAFSPFPQQRPYFRVRSQAAPGFRSPPLGGAPLSNSLPKRRSQRCAPRKKSAKVPAPECVPMTFPT